MGTVLQHKSGPNLLIRAVWWLFIGWWASGIVVTIAWVSLVTIIGIPLGIYLINRLPTVLTLRPRSRTSHLGQDEESRPGDTVGSVADVVQARKAAARPD